MKNFLLGLLLMLWIPHTCLAQNLYDARNSGDFAQYLKQSGQYQLAAVEFERLVFIHPQSDSLRYALLDCYILAEDFGASIRRSAQLQTLNSTPDPLLTSYQTWSMLKNKQFEATQNFLNASLPLSSDGKAYYRAWNLVLQDKYKEASTIIQTLGPDQRFDALRQIQADAVKLPRRSPAVAAMMSAIVPGSGKWYAGEKKDALVGLVTIGVMAYQAWKGFSKDGSGSVYGWISAGLGTGFYLGNIYGSARSAKRFNQRQYKKLHPYIDQNFILYR